MKRFVLCISVLIYMFLSGCSDLNEGQLESSDVFVWDTTIRGDSLLLNIQELKEIESVNLERFLESNIKAWDTLLNVEASYDECFGQTDNLILPIGRSFGTEFEPYTFLNIMYNAKYYRYSLNYLQDTIPMIRWRCRSCEKKKAEYLYMEEFSEIFPSDIMSTFISSVFQWESNNVSRKAIVVNHYSEIEPEFTGRYCGTITGIYVFIKVGRQWRLESGDHCLGSFGAFKEPFVPRLYLNAKEELLVDCSYSNGGPGAPYSGLGLLYACVNGNWTKVFYSDGFSLYNTCAGEWKSEFNLKMNETENILIVRSSGYFQAIACDGFVIEEWLEQIMPQRIRSEWIKYKPFPFEFVLEREFEFDEGKYREKSSRLQSKFAKFIFRKPKPSYCFF